MSLYDAFPEFEGLPENLAAEIAEDPDLFDELWDEHTFHENRSCEMVGGMLVSTSELLSEDEKDLLSGYFQFLKERKAQEK